MNHTYDSLRELACLALTTPSLEAATARLVIQDALRDAGVWISQSEGRPSFYEDWADTWMMKAVYGPRNVDRTYRVLVAGKWETHEDARARGIRSYSLRYPMLLTWALEPGVDTSDHRAMAEERIAVRRLGGTWRCKSSKNKAA